MSENKYPFGGYAPLKQLLGDLIECVINDRLMLGATPNGRPHDPDPEIDRLRREILYIYGEPAGAVCDPDFIEFIKNERDEITKEMLSDEWWLTIAPVKRVVIENMLIAYDQMVEKLSNEIGTASNKEDDTGNALYETRLALRMMLKVFKNDQISKEQKKYYSQAEGVLKKHFDIKDVLR